MAPALSPRIIAFGSGFRLFRDATFFRRRQFHARSSRLRQADCNSLLRRPRSMLTFPDVIHLLAYELSGLRAGRFTFPGILTSSFDCLFFGHHYLHCELVFCVNRRCSSRGKVCEANCRTSGSVALCDSWRNSPNLTSAIAPSAALRTKVVSAGASFPSAATTIPETATPNKTITVSCS